MRIQLVALSRDGSPLCQRSALPAGPQSLRNHLLALAVDLPWSREIVATAGDYTVSWGVGSALDDAVARKLWEHLLLSERASVAPGE
jgi:hypothetical protein